MWSNSPAEMIPHKKRIRVFYSNMGYNCVTANIQRARTRCVTVVALPDASYRRSFFLLYEIIKITGRTRAFARSLSHSAFIC